MARVARSLIPTRDTTTRGRHDGKETERCYLVDFQAGAASLVLASVVPASVVPDSVVLAAVVPSSDRTPDPVSQAASAGKDLGPASAARANQARGASSAPRPAPPHSCLTDPAMAPTL